MVNRTRLAVLAVLAILVATTAVAQVSLTTLGSPSTQNFDTLANTGTTVAWSDNTTLAGWYAQFTAVPTNPTTYTVGTGSSNTGAMYSFGVAGVNPITERALGSVASATPGAIYYAVRLVNNTGTALTSLDISFDGEQWRNGGNATPQKLDFQYQVANAGVITDANTPTTSWIDLDTLDFTGPIATATAAALDGNAAANRTNRSATLTVTVNAGQEIWLRWKDSDDAGSDHGLAIDDFSVTPHGTAPNNPPTITPPANPITTVAQNAAPFTVGLSGSDDGGIYNWSATPGTGLSAVNVTGGQGTNSVTYTVTLTAGYSGTATFTATLTDNVNTPVNQAVNITVVAPPATPTGLAAAAGTSQISLSWNSAGGATSYNVKRSTTSGAETTIASPGTNSYNDTTTTDGTPYFYVVSAVGAGGEGSNSAEVTATSMAAPTGLAPTPGNAHVVLNWNSVAGATGYNVKRSTTTGTETTLASTATNTYDDLTAANGVQYFYVVTATNGNGESVASSEVNATPNTPGVLVISQVYGGAGCGTAGCSAYKNDYIELFNRGGSPISVNGWSVQYAAATGTTWQVTNLPNVSVQAGQYFLVAEGAGANGVSVLPTPDVTGTIAMSATAGKVALVSSTVALSGACPSTNVVDEVGFGATANCSETSPAPAPSTSNAIFRASGGCNDAGNNSTDFAAAAAAPRNTASPTHSCVNTPPTIVPPGNPITTVTMNAAPFPVNLSGSDDGGIYNWSDTPGTGVASVNVTGGQGTNTVTYTVTITAGFTGTATFTASLTDGVTAPASQPVNILVNPPAPPPAPTGLNATVGNAHVQLNWNAVGGATSYSVKRGTTTGGPYSVINSPGTNSYDDTTAVNGTTYFYVVSAIGPGGEGANSSEVSATPATAPAAPTGLVPNAGVSHAALTWNASAGATSYTVKRGTAPGGPYGTTFPGLVTTSYDDTTAINGITYYYVVTATNAQGTSPDSNEVTATPAPLVAPAGLAAAVSDSAVVLTWSSVQGAATYNVKRSTAAGGPYTAVGSPAGLSFTDNTAANTITYYYVVAAFSGSEGPISSEVSATPNTPAFLGVVVSQVYGGGGNAGATLKNDYVELYNRGTQTVSLVGFYVHYTSAAATTWASANSPTALVGSIAPGQHYLVQESQGAGGTTNLPTPDATGLIAMGATGGKIALVVSSVALTGACPTGSFIADFVGYGTANCFEGAGPTAATTNTTAALRLNGGCTDTNNNGADFTTGPPNPHNLASGVSVCAPSNNPPSITTPANPIATVTQDDPPFTVTLHGSDDGAIYNWTATPGTGIQSVTVTGGQGTADVTYTVTLVAGFHGFASFTATLSDNVNSPVSQTVNIQVNQVGGGNNSPLIIPPSNPITSVAQDAAPFTAGLTGSDDGGIYNWTATPGTGVASVNVTGGQGTTNVTYTITLSAGFNGTATFTATLSDNVNPPVNQPVNITVTPVAGPSSHLVISQVYGGGGNSGATYQNDYVELYNPTASPVNVTGWSIQYSSATSTGSFSGVQGLGGSIGPGEYYLIGLGSGGAIGSPLPVANISNNSINISGTTGKVALVSNGTPLTGSCPAPLTDPHTVDFVGYGTANCAEGNADAPAPSNSTAIFRKNNGTTDTDNNAGDFLTGVPNPRRTTPISEIGPSITSTDPVLGASIVPRDGSVIVSFSEPVTVDPGWYDITCVSTGSHNDATVAAGAGASWVIIPNTNFQAGEQCTATVFATFVHDVDLDDSAPGTDTLPSDQSWSFTIATGAAPPYPPGVHLTMGTPSACVADLLSPNSYLMMKPEMSICYSRDFGRPNWVSWHLTDEWNGTLARVDTFRADPGVPPAWYRVLGTDFSLSGFDRGHMTPNADRDLQTSIPINQATYLMSNMVAQAPDNNQGPWAALENYLRSLLPADELYIISGPNGVGGSGSNGGTTTTLANGHVTVPASTWKVVMVLPKLSGDDLARVTASTRTIAVVMPNVQGIRNNDWHMYLTSVDQVEALTGYDFFSNVPPAIQNAIEGGIDGANPPGTANQSTSTNEDVQDSITLDAATPGGSLTYSILTGPFHGGLTGSGANRTYTPAPDFNGTDTFTWRVNDGTNNSNTSTMTITVLEVNDPPTASDDSKATTANGVLTFASSDLTANDSPGPANESGQTLAVSLVTPTANTHGTVMLSAGQVSYTPDPGYIGPASFTYSVCDNGVTVGLADPKCSTATVNVTVNAQVTTHFSVAAPASVTAGVPFNVTVTALDASNATVTSYTGTVHFTSSSAGTLPADYPFVAGDNGAHTFTATLTTTGSQSINAADGGITGSANPTVLAAPATHFSITAPANVTTGVAFNVTVTALDASNATVPGYTGTVHFTSSSAGTLPSDYTFVGGDAGAHTFSVTLTTIGAQSVTATDTVTASITGSANTTVGALPATHFNVAAPANVTAGVAFNVTVTALDASNTTVTGYTGTAHFTSSSAGTLPSDYTFAGGDAGAHAFSVTLTTTGAQSVTATDTVTASIAGSANTTVGAPPATHFSVAAPANVTAGVAFNVTVTALDASNATVPGYTGTAHFTSSSAGTLPSDYAFVGGDAGAHTFSVTLTTTGAQSVTATDTVTASIAGTASTTVNCPALSVTASNNGPACIGGSVQLNASTAATGVTFAWTGPGGFTSTQQNPSVTTAGTYSVTMTGVSGCTASSSTNVVFTSAPSANITAPASVCANRESSASVASAGPGATYNWTITGGTILSGAGTSAITFSAPVTSTTVALSVSVSTPVGCSVSASRNVSVKSPPGATLPGTIAVCGPQIIAIPVTLTGTAPWTIVWSDGVEQDNVTTATLTRSFNATASTTLGIEVLIDASCYTSAPTNVVHINVDGPPVITTQPHDTFVAPGSAVSFTVSSTGSNPHYQWFQQEGNGIVKTVGTDASSYATDPVHGNSTVWVVISNGCGSVESVHVQAGVQTSKRRASGH